MWGIVSKPRSCIICGSPSTPPNILDVSEIVFFLKSSTYWKNTNDLYVLKTKPATTKKAKHKTLFVCCCLYQFQKLSRSLFCKMHEKKQVGSWTLVLYSVWVPLNEMSVPPSCLSPGLPGVQKWSIGFLAGTCRSALFGTHRCFSKDSYFCFLSLSLSFFNSWSYGDGS